MGILLSLSLFLFLFFYNEGIGRECEGKGGALGWSVCVWCGAEDDVHCSWNVDGGCPLEASVKAVHIHESFGHACLATSESIQS